jgi:hypothetical protein
VLAVFIKAGSKSNPITQRQAAEYLWIDNGFGDEVGK